jgi:hypothetical protein
VEILRIGFRSWIVLISKHFVWASALPAFNAIELSGFTHVSDENWCYHDIKYIEILKWIREFLGRPPPMAKSICRIWNSRRPIFGGLKMRWNIQKWDRNHEKARRRRENFGILKISGKNVWEKISELTTYFSRVARTRTKKSIACGLTNFRHGFPEILSEGFY